MKYHPMPDDIGFQIPRSIGEMLPDQLLVEPERPRGRYGKDIHVSMSAYTCLTCGKIFESGPEYKYITKDGRCCSYHCFRPFEIAAQEKFRKDTMGYVPECSRSKSPVERAHARVEKCRKKLEGYQAIRRDPQAWAALPHEKRRNITDAISRWKRKLNDAQRALEEIEANETT